VVGASVYARTQEFGVKLALGATRRELLLAILREGAMLSVWGVALGFGLALMLSRALRTLLFEVPANDVASFAAVAALLVLVILAACLVPARRAASVDPQVALRVG
jgi:ABC-type antimicrobial peptide transport system permease subunit